MSSIRINHSGLIAFVVSLISMITGLVVTIMITRNLTSSEYGTWTLIMNFIGYVIILEPIISYWVTRETARGTESGSTAITANGLFSFAGIIVFVAILFFVGTKSGADISLMLNAVILIPVIFINRTLIAIIRGFKPHIASFGVLIHSTVQIPSLLILVYYFDYGLEGVILSVFFGYLFSSVLLLYYGKEKIKKNLEMKFVKKWFKLSWLTLYPGIYTTVSLMDITIFSVITNSVIGIAFWGVAMVIPIMISQAANISYAIYPKILGSGENKLLKENFSLLFYFALPLTAISIVLAKPGLFILNPIYIVAAPVVIFSSLFVFFNSLNTTFYYTLLGIEKVDIHEKSTFRSYLKSRLFFLPTVLLIQYAIYISLLSLGIIIGQINKLSEIELVILWSIIALISHAPFTFYFNYLVKRDLKTSLDFSRISKYVLCATISFGISLFLIENFLDYDQHFYDFVFSLILIVIFGIGLYVGMTYLIDYPTRRFFKDVLERSLE